MLEVTFGIWKPLGKHFYLPQLTEKPESSLFLERTIPKLRSKQVNDGQTLTQCLFIERVCLDINYFSRSQLSVPQF